VQRLFVQQRADAGVQREPIEPEGSRTSATFSAN
jgi:hypothetical protein